LCAFLVFIGFAKAPFAFIFALIFALTLGWPLTLLFGVIPALASGLSGILVRRVGYNKLFLPAAMLGG
jgi:hypothetical protein